jgi:hypothetical protein
MVVRLNDVKHAFDDLISGARSREEVSNWARRLRVANENAELGFDPVEAKAQLWRTITYLEGVDLKDSPSTYLHVVSDFQAFRKQFGL